eukprot:scaffold897_cov402-Prasinococcus_capsulatus_cf.AAC.64
MTVPVTVPFRRLRKSVLLAGTRSAAPGRQESHPPLPGCHPPAVSSAPRRAAILLRCWAQPALLSGPRDSSRHPLIATGLPPPGAARRSRASVAGPRSGRLRFHGRSVQRAKQRWRGAGPGGRRGVREPLPSCGHRTSPSRP